MNKIISLENKVNSMLMGLLGNYKTKMTLNSGTDRHSGRYWEIEPKNPRAAKLNVGDVDERTITIAIDEHWIEIHTSPKKWEEGLSKAEKYLKSALEGHVTSWRQKSVGDSKEKKALQITIDNQKPIFVTENVLFVKRFIKRHDIVREDYEPY